MPKLEPFCKMFDETFYPNACVSQDYKTLYSMLSRRFCSKNLLIPCVVKLSAQP